MTDQEKTDPDEPPEIPKEIGPDMPKGHPGRINVGFNWDSLPKDAQARIEAGIADRAVEHTPVERLIDEAISSRVNEMLGDDLDAVVQEVVDDEMATLTEKHMATHFEVPSPTDSMDQSQSRELVIEEVNRRIVEPMLLGFAILSFAAAIGSVLAGSLLGGILFITFPILTVYSLWRSRLQGDS